MSHSQIEDIHVRSFEPLVSPNELRKDIPVSDELKQRIASHRAEITDVLHQRDPRLLVILGPCSIHDGKAGLEYAERLKELSEKVKDQLLLVMRVYFEKPRTTVGWKG